jgi:hypothetical protein
MITYQTHTTTCYKYHSDSPVDVHHHCTITGPQEWSDLQCHSTGTSHRMLDILPIPASTKITGS